MKRFLSFVAAATMAVGSLTFAGCESSNMSRPGEREALFGGGNGAFGESPEQPGVYSNESHLKPASSSPRPSVANGE